MPKTLNEKKILFGKIPVGLSHKPFVIAEMSGNHNHSLQRAKKLIDAAAKSGAHALKIQTYTPDTITIDHDSDDFMIRDKKSLWKGEKLYDLYKKAMTPWEWHKTIFDHCKKRKILCFSTPFDHTSVKFLEKLNCPFYKIASFENGDFPLLKAVAKTKKPIIMSTGTATLSQITESVSYLKSLGVKDLVLLKCTSSYPADPKNTNITTIPHMRDLFQCEIGLSDHTFGVGVAVASVALGATVIEKHFTLRRADGGVDSAFSLEPEELQSLVVETERAWQALGQVTYGPTPEEEKSLRFRRSLYFVKDIKAGEKITAENMRSIRPGFGLEPKHYETLLGKTVTKNVKRGDPVTWKVLK